MNTGANCDHHGEGHHCGDHDDDDCHCGDHDDDDCHCGHGGGGCGCHPEGKNVGKKVKVHYRGTFNDGTQFDSSYDRNAPLEFICGAGHMIAGFDAAVANMEVGQAIDIHLMPNEAYGESDPDAIGEQVYLQDQFGRPFPVKVAAKDDKTITFDANHAMAGKELNFRIELLEVDET